MTNRNYNDGVGPWWKHNSRGLALSGQLSFNVNGSQVSEQYENGKKMWSGWTSAKSRRFNKGRNVVCGIKQIVWRELQSEVGGSITVQKLVCEGWHSFVGELVRDTEFVKCFHVLLFELFVQAIRFYKVVRGKKSTFHVTWKFICLQRALLYDKWSVPCLQWKVVCGHKSQEDIACIRWNQGQILSQSSWRRWYQ